MTERLGPERRNMLKQAALELASQHGIEGATIKRIADKCGVTPALVYHHFKNKEELMLEVLKDNTFAAILERMIGDIEKLPVEEGLTRVALAYVNMLRQKGPLVSVLVGESMRNPIVATRFSEVVRKTGDILEGYLKAKIKAGELPPFDIRMAIQMLFGHLFTAFLHKERFQMQHLPPVDEDFVRRSVRLFLSGWRQSGQNE